MYLSCSDRMFSSQERRLDCELVCEEVHIGQRDASKLALDLT